MIQRMISAVVLGLVAMSATSAQDRSDEQLDEAPLASADAMAMAASTENYWTAEKLAAAKPMPLPVRIVDDASTGPAMLDLASAGDDAQPGFAPGWDPRSRQPFQDIQVTIQQDDPLYAVATGATSADISEVPLHGPAPNNPRLGPYGPFQRWTEIDPIRTFPKSTHGKYFFTLNGRNFVCSATVIHRSTLITAGHCNSDGAGTFATNRLFCPSYKNGVDPKRGCWSVVASKTSAGWHTGGDPDHDYACLVTQTTGTVKKKSVGKITGWMGRAWNWSARQAVRTFGYPQAAPFNGNRLITTASTEWYETDFRAGGQRSKMVGSDLTGGSSGGSWILGWQRPGHEFADSDSISGTDPGANWVNGVNSHKRCRVNCNTPPTNTTGVFWQEMSSPPFRNTAAADETEDIVSVCFAAGGTN